MASAYKTPPNVAGTEDLGIQETLIKSLSLIVYFFECEINTTIIILIMTQEIIIIKLFPISDALI